MKSLQEIVQSKEVAFGMYHKSVECKNLEDFCSNAEIGQKWIDSDNETCHYKIADEDGNAIVFELLAGKAHISN
jgi:penicillin V acylase-like amidase (Ntn superfamily)